MSVYEESLELIKRQIEKEIRQNDVVLYMKGTKDIPECGFSSVVVAILKKLDLDFKDINVLSNNKLRQAIKDYSEWPTIPQLYIKGEFVGGSDIVREMYDNGELLKLINLNKIIRIK